MQTPRSASKEMIMTNDAKPDDTPQDEQTEEMEKVQEDAAEERKNNAGY
jgi:hypothetical protein